MICRQCGRDIPEGNNFCDYCGAPAEPPAGKKEKNGPKKNAKRLIIGSAVLVVVLGCIAGFIISSLHQGSAAYTNKLASAQTSIAEGNESEAEQILLDLIAAEPKKEAAYLDLADLYVAREEFEKADQIIEKGKKQAGESEQFDQKKTIVTSHVSYRKRLKKDGLATVGTKFVQGSDGGGIISSLPISGSKDPRWIETAMSDPERVLTITLYGLKDEKNKALDKAELELDDGHIGARYDIYTQKSGERLLLCVGVYQVDNPEEWLSAVRIYEVRDSSLEELTDIRFINGYFAFRAEINGEAVAEYTPPTGSMGDIDEAEESEAAESGIRSIRKELEKTGADIEINLDEFNRMDGTAFFFENAQNPDHHISRITFGEFDENGLLELTAGSENTYLEDYTGIRDRLKDNNAEKTKGSSPLDHYAKINEVGNPYGSINKKYQLTDVGWTDQWVVCESSDQDLNFSFIASKWVGPAEWEYELADEDLCLRMSGSAEKLLGITKDMPVEEFEKKAEADLQPGQGMDLETAGYRGQAGYIRIKGVESRLHILFRDVDEDGTISPDTLVDVEEER